MQDDTYNSDLNEIGTKEDGGLEQHAQSNYVAELLSQKILGLESGVKDTKMVGVYMVILFSFMAFQLCWPEIHPCLG